MSGTHIKKWSAQSTAYVKDLVLGKQISRHDLANDATLTNLKANYDQLAPYSVRQISTHVSKILKALSPEVKATLSLNTRHTSGKHNKLIPDSVPSQF